MYMYLQPSKLSRSYAHPLKAELQYLLDSSTDFSQHIETAHTATLFISTQYRQPEPSLNTAEEQARSRVGGFVKMSLNIPNAPNAGLFKQGYNKYGSTPTMKNRIEIPNC